MPLHLYFNDEPLPADREVLRNVEAFFISPTDKISEPLRQVLKQVEQAEPSTKTSDRFIDRFGAELYWSCLSTGTKTAFVLCSYQDKIIDACECGRNAIQSIVEHITCGHLMIPYPTYSLPHTPVDVILHGKHFTDGMALDHYRKEECL